MPQTVPNRPIYGLIEPTVAGTSMIGGGTPISRFDLDFDWDREAAEEVFDRDLVYFQ